jgi:hypothetical protein
MFHYSLLRVGSLKEEMMVMMQKTFASFQNQYFSLLEMNFVSGNVE